ncbi:hypothetical protein HK098_007162 [Nowakowskiella sp. JEL0407]|nr:hypothetical protein HK098_007162 [Nowakowskiella sp. JEL0407]
MAKLLISNVTAKSVANLNFHALKACNFKVLVFDKDDTLTFPYHDNIHPPLIKAWDEALSVFGRQNVVIFSNSAGSSDDKDFKDAARIESTLGVKVIRHNTKKPNGFTSLISHIHSLPKPPPQKQTLEKVTTTFSPNSKKSTFVFSNPISEEKKVQPHEIVMIGDRAFTDVVFANSNGMASILLTKPIREKGGALTSLLRKVEVGLIGILNSVGYKAPSHRLLNEKCLESVVKK